MAAIAFDPLEYTHQLEASGVPRAQAEVHARAMTAMFLHNIDLALERIGGRFNLLYWMQGLTIICIVVPALRNLLS